MGRGKNELQMELHGKTTMFWRWNYQLNNQNRYEYKNAVKYTFIRKIAIHNL